MAIVELTTCGDIVEANLIKGMLDNEGIECFLNNADFKDLLPHNRGIDSGIQIMIDSKDKDKALRLINVDKSSPVLCTGCNSKNVVPVLYRKIGKLLTILLSALIFVPFGKKVNYHCKDCGNVFKS